MLHIFLHVFRDVLHSIFHNFRDDVPLIQLVMLTLLLRHRFCRMQFGKKVEMTLQIILTNGFSLGQLFGQGDN